MARQGVAMTLGEQRESIIQALVYCMHIQDIGACCCKFYCERYTVEPTADADNRRDVLIAQLERIDVRHRAFDEQLYGWKRHRCGRRQRFARTWHRQRRKPVRRTATVLRSPWPQFAKLLPTSSRDGPARL